LRKFFWLIVVIISLIGAIVFNRIFLIEFFSSTVLVTVRLGSLDLIHFPAITVCNNKKVKRSFMLEANLTSAAEQLTVMDYFFYGRKQFSEEEMVFINQFLDSEPLNNMLDDMIANVVDNFDNPRKHVTYDDRMAHVDTWHSFIDWALFYSGVEGGYDYKQGLKGLDKATRRIWMEKYVSQLMSQYKYGQMVPFIGWGGKQMLDWGASDFGTDLGRCHFIGAVQNEEESIKMTLAAAPGSIPGKNHGLRLIMDAEVFDTGPGKDVSEGFTIAPSFWNDFPIMDHAGIGITVGTATEMGIATTVVETTDIAKSRFTPEERGCFFNDEIKMVNCNADVGCRYEFSNCLFEAYTDKVRSECECDTVFWSMPTADDVCKGEKLNCVRNLIKQIGEFTEVLDLQTNTTRTCIAACDTTYYTEVTPSAADFPSMETFLKTWESCIVGKKLVDTCNDFRRGPLEEAYPGICNLIKWIEDNDAFCKKDNVWDTLLLQSSPGEFDYQLFRTLLARYARENVAVVNVFLNAPQTQILGVNEKTSIIDAVSSVGGLLGLFMGFTFVTVAEIIYFGLSLGWTICTSILPPPGIPGGRRGRRKAAAASDNVKAQEAWNDKGDGLPTINSPEY